MSSEAEAVDHQGSFLKIVERNPKYFHPARTQPFLITFFQAVLAFRKVCKMMRMRIGKKKQFNLHKRSTTFKVELTRSKQLIANARKGQPVIHYDIVQNYNKLGKIEKADEEFYRRTSFNLSRFERLFKQVNKQLERYLTKERHNKAAEVLDEKLTKIMQNSLEAARESKRKSITHTLKRATTIRFSDTPLMAQTHNLFQYFVNSHQHEQQQQQQQQQNANNNNADQATDKQMEEAHEGLGEYLEGTTIYYGSTIAIQARHGGFLSYNSGQIKASAHKILSNSRFVVKKSDDLTDIGLMKFGDALWLQAGTGYVLGAQYGSLIDQKREIQPALVSCKRQSMFKAQQYGRWIVLHKDDPVGTLGKPVTHLDRVILEQEWYFLASHSPYDSSMWKSVNNSDEAMTTKINLFNPADECTWKLHLVSLPSDDKDDSRARQQLLQEAKDQILVSSEFRYRKAEFLSKDLSELLDPELKDSNLINTLLKHKASLPAEQDYLFKKYCQLEKENFSQTVSKPAFLANIYGNDSRIVSLTAETLRLQRINQNVSQSSTSSYVDAEGTGNLGESSKNQSTVLEAGSSENNLFLQFLENNYWDIAQRLLIKPECYTELFDIMEEYHEKDYEKKSNAASKLQFFMKRKIDKIFSFPRAMKRVDEKVKFKLEEKDFLRRQLLLENGGILSSTLTKSSSEQQHHHHARHSHHSLGFGDTSIPSTNHPQSQQQQQSQQKNHQNLKCNESNRDSGTSTPNHPLSRSATPKELVTLPKTARSRPLSASFLSLASSAATSRNASVDYTATDIANHNLAIVLSSSLVQSMMASGTNQSMGIASRSMSPSNQYQQDHTHHQYHAQEHVAPSSPKMIFHAPPQQMKIKIPKTRAHAHIYKTHSLTSFPNSPSSGSPKGPENEYHTIQPFSRPQSANQIIGLQPPSMTMMMEGFHSSNLYELQQQQQRRQRPQSASNIHNKKGREERQIEKEMEKELLKQRLMKTEDRDYGLPQDCFDIVDDKYNLKLGVKFLKSISSNHHQHHHHHHHNDSGASTPSSRGGGGPAVSKSFNNLFDDIKVKRRRPQSHR